MLSQIPQCDVVTSEHWSSLKKAITLALGDEDERLSVSNIYPNWKLKLPISLSFLYRLSRGSLYLTVASKVLYACGLSVNRGIVNEAVVLSSSKEVSQVGVTIWGKMRIKGKLWTFFEDIKDLLTECEVYTGKYLPEVFEQTKKLQSWPKSLGQLAYS